MPRNPEIEHEIRRLRQRAEEMGLRLQNIHFAFICGEDSEDAARKAQAEFNAAMNAYRTLHDGYIASLRAAYPGRPAA